MGRISEKKEIVDSEKYSQLSRDYKSVLTSLDDEFSNVILPENSNFVNFKENSKTPKHNWLKYKEGYASQLVSKIIKENSFDKSKITLDPFCGVGTTNLVAQENGIENIGFDINPIAILASKVKTRYYNSVELEQVHSFVSGDLYDEPFQYNELPRVLISSFTPDVLDKLLRLKTRISSLEDEKIRSLLNLAFISIIEDCSIRVKDGNGIKLKKNKVFISDVNNYFINKVLRMVKDVEGNNSKVESTFYEKSSIHELEEYVQPESVSLSVFSPPYANCFDYLEVYKLEVWLGGFADEYGDFKKYREVAMRSHVNSKFNHHFDYLNDEVNIISELISSFNIWNKNIPDMIRGYFDDTNKLLSQLYNTLISGGKVYIVVANSVYKGIAVPTDILIGRLAKRIGYQVNKIGVARKIRASSQQIPELDVNNLMRESIIELEK